MENKNEYVFAVKRGESYVSGVACDDLKNIWSYTCIAFSDNPVFFGKDDMINNLLSLFSEYENGNLIPMDVDVIAKRVEELEARHEK